MAYKALAKTTGITKSITGIADNTHRHVLKKYGGADQILVNILSIFQLNVSQITCDKMGFTLLKPYQST